MIANLGFFSFLTILFDRFGMSATSKDLLFSSHKCIFQQKVSNMATSSIKNSFTVAGTKQIESFVRAVERSLKNPVPRNHVNAEVLSGASGLRKLSLLRKKHGL